MSGRWRSMSLLVGAFRRDWEKFRVVAHGVKNILPLSHVNMNLLYIH
jgi:hypothetical protein